MVKKKNMEEKQMAKSTATGANENQERKITFKNNLGEKAEGDEFAVMEQLERLTRIPAPKNLRGLRERPVRHTTVLDREEMLPFVLEKAQEKKWF